jgi:hypothetical protein
MKNLIILALTGCLFACSVKSSETSTATPFPVDGIPPISQASTMNPKAAGYWNLVSGDPVNGEQPPMRLRIDLNDDGSYTVGFCHDRYSRGGLSKAPADNEIDFPKFGADRDDPPWKAFITSADDSQLVFNGRYYYDRFNPPGELNVMVSSGDQSLCNNDTL